MRQPLRSRHYVPVGARSLADVADAAAGRGVQTETASSAAHIHGCCGHPHQGREPGRFMSTRTRWPPDTAGWGGAAAGAVLGILFPPSILGTAVIGGAIGGVSGHVELLGEVLLEDHGEQHDEVDGYPSASFALDHRASTTPCHGLLG